MKPRQQIAVLGIRTGQFIPFAKGFSTDCEATAAKALEPGTTFGVGESEASARVNAEARRQVHLGQGY